MARKHSAFLNLNRITISALVLCLLASVGLYRWVAYPFSVTEAVAAETAITFMTESHKIRKTALDSTNYPYIFRYFPDLRQDFSQFSQLLISDGQAVWSIAHLGGDRYALSCATEAYRVEAPISERVSVGMSSLRLPWLIMLGVVVERRALEPEPEGLPVDGADYLAGHKRISTQHAGQGRSRDRYGAHA